LALVDEWFSNVLPQLRFIQHPWTDHAAYYAAAVNIDCQETEEIKFLSEAVAE
jgi:hypothetical protein